jgi:protein-S-isoprenylcysteine O-methyltransferase Ste14
MMVITEEEYLLHMHGETYRQYCRRVPRYLGFKTSQLPNTG